MNSLISINDSLNEKLMKKIFMAVYALAACVFWGCTDEIRIDGDVEDTSFIIHASIPETRTANEGMKTVWVDRDDLSVFHAAAGTEDYVFDGQFVVSSSDPESGVFSGKLAEELNGDAYDWYFFYPYVYNRTTPAYQSTAISTIGNSSGQTQAGYGDMTHVSGKRCPLYAVAKAVRGSDVPSVKMNHFASLVRIKVTNRSGKPITVTSAELTAPEEIVGQFYLGLSEDGPVYRAKSTAAAKSTAKLSVTGDEVLADGAVADLYMLVKPFVAETGETLTLKVNNLTRTLTMTEDVEFHAGKIKTLNFVINKEDIKDPSEYRTPDGKQWFFTTYSGGFIDDNHKVVVVLDLGVVAEGKFTYATQMPQPNGSMIWQSLFSEIEFEYKINPIDDNSGVISLPGTGIAFEYSQYDGNSSMHIVDDLWFGDEFDCEAGLYNVTKYYKGISQ